MTLNEYAEWLRTQCQVWLQAAKQEEKPVRAHALRMRAQGFADARHELVTRVTDPLLWAGEKPQ